MTLPRQPLNEFQTGFSRSLDHMGGTLLASTAATGSITCAANAAGADGDTVTISDGINPAVVYEYDKSSNGVTAGRISFGPGTTADSVALLLQTAINATQPEFTTSDNGSGVLSLTAKEPGVFANVNITRSGNITSAVTGMSGGTDPSLGMSATNTVALCTLDNTTRIDSVELLNPAGFVADAANYWVITLQDSTTVMASWSTLTGAEGTITANVAAKMTLSATDTHRIGAAGDLLKLVFTKHGSALPFPPGRIVVHGRVVA